MAKFITANDITETRCTVTGCYDSRSAADAAVESDEESQVFETESPIHEGVRAYHQDGRAWFAGQNALEF